MSEPAVAYPPCRWTPHPFMTWSAGMFVLPNAARTSDVSWIPPRHHAGERDGDDRPRSDPERLARGWCVDLHGMRDWMIVFGYAELPDGRVVWTHAGIEVRDDRR